jgi:hypothetical protein
MNKIDSIKGELEKIWGSKVYVMRFDFDINSYCDAKDYDRRFSVIFNDKKSVEAMIDQLEYLKENIK